MDKKNLIFGLLCLFGAFSLFIYQGKQLQQQAILRQSQVADEEAANTEGGKQPKADVAPTSSELKNLPEFRLPTLKPTDERLVVLENDAVKVTFTTIGGGICSVELKKFAAERDSDAPYVFNREAVFPALIIGRDAEHLWTQSFAVTQQSDDFIQFRAVLEDGTDVVRGYKLPPSKAKNPYLIQTEISVTQPSGKGESVDKPHPLWISLGSMPEMPGDKYREHLNFCAYDGKSMDCKRLADFEASNGFLGLGGHEAHPYLEANMPCTWGALKDQFFTAILTPKTPAVGCFSFPSKQGERSSMQGFLKFELTQPSTVLGATYYVGPKDYLLLEHMGQRQDELMQFGFFGAVSKVLLMTMHGIHSVIHNWGWTILILTVIIKLLMWPVTQMQLRSSKKMATIQEPLKILREKYKDNPQKLQAETMKLFKENRINPASGCLPAVIQIPIFIGLYYMLRSASEIRFQPFLWVKDLSMPDTVGYLGSFPINIMPLLMGVTMVVQMKVTPMPSTDSAQQKIFMLMPFIFLFFCYNFPAALVLYWTVQNLFTIVQNKLTYRRGSTTLQQQKV